MVDVGDVHVRVLDRRVLVVVRMGLAAVPFEVMRVPMMLVVPVRMRVPEHVVPVLMSMTLGNVQPHAERHQRAGDGYGKRRRLVLDPNSVQRAEKGCDRVIGTRSCGAQMTQREHEQREAHAIRGESQRKCCDDRPYIRHVSTD